MTNPLIRSLSASAAGAVLLLFLSSCEYWEDWLDRDKPEPPDPITRSPQNAVSYTQDEAAALICNKLIMRFSRLSNKPVLICREETDSMAKRVALLLVHSNVTSGAGCGDDLYQIESKPSGENVWHPVVIHVLSGKTVLDETVPLRNAAL